MLNTHHLLSLFWSNHPLFLYFAVIRHRGIMLGQRSSSNYRRHCGSADWPRDWNRALMHRRFISVLFTNLSCFRRTMVTMSHPLLASQLTSATFGQSSHVSHVWSISSRQPLLASQLTSATIGQSAHVSHISPASSRQPLFANQPASLQTWLKVGILGSSWVTGSQHCRVDTPLTRRS